MYISALTKRRIVKVIKLDDFVAEQNNRRISTSELNQVLNDAMLINPLPGGGNKKIKIMYSTQVATSPPTFVLFANHPDEVHFSYLRYLENVMRKNFGFEGTPIRLILRQKTSIE